MSKKLLALFGGGCQVSPDGTWVPTPDPAEWKSERKLSGTYNEAANLLRLVRRDMFDEMVIVRREVHLRPIIFTMMRLNEPEFADLKDKVSAGELHIQERTVESILWNANSGEYHERINSIHRSRSYQRSLLREGNALMNFGEGITQIIQKSQEQTAPAAK